MVNPLPDQMVDAFFGKSIALNVETRLDDARFVPFEPVLIRVPGYTRT